MQFSISYYCHSTHSPEFKSLVKWEIKFLFIRLFHILLDPDPEHKIRIDAKVPDSSISATPLYCTYNASNRDNPDYYPRMRDELAPSSIQRQHQELSLHGRDATRESDGPGESGEGSGGRRNLGARPYPPARGDLQQDCGRHQGSGEVLRKRQEQEEAGKRRQGGAHWKQPRGRRRRGPKGARCRTCQLQRGALGWRQQPRQRSLVGGWGWRTAPLEGKGRPEEAMGRPPPLVSKSKRSY